MRNVLLPLFVVSSFSLFSQDKGALSLEIGGVGGFGSISYSKEFKKNGQVGSGLQSRLELRAH